MDPYSVYASNPNKNFLLAQNKFFFRLAEDDNRPVL